VIRPPAKGPQVANFTPFALVVQANSLLKLDLAAGGRRPCAVKSAIGARKLATSLATEDTAGSSSSRKFAFISRPRDRAGPAPGAPTGSECAAMPFRVLQTALVFEDGSVVAGPPIAK